MSQLIPTNNHIKLLNQIFSYETHAGTVYSVNLIRQSYKTLYSVELLPGEKIREDMIDSLDKYGFKLVMVDSRICVDKHDKLCQTFLIVHVEYVEVV